MGFNYFALNTGAEDLNVFERLKTYFSELSLGIDKFNADFFNSSIHKVEPRGLFQALIKQDKYLTLSTIQIPTPVFFNPKELKWSEYVDLCLEAVGLVKLSQVETDKVYKAFKMALVKNEVPYSIRSFALFKDVDNLEQKLNKVFDRSNVTSQPLNSLFINFTEASMIFSKFNKGVENLKSRDVEVLSKSVDNVVQLLKLMRTKLEAGDLTYSQDEITTIELCANRLKGLILFCGRLTSLLSALSRVMQLQLEAIENANKIK